MNENSSENKSGALNELYFIQCPKTQSTTDMQLPIFAVSCFKWFVKPEKVIRMQPAEQPKRNPCFGVNEHIILTKNIYRVVQAPAEKNKIPRTYAKFWGSLAKWVGEGWRVISQIIISHLKQAENTKGIVEWETLFCG